LFDEGRGFKEKKDFHLERLSFVFISLVPAHIQRPPSNSIELPSFLDESSTYYIKNKPLRRIRMIKNYPVFLNPFCFILSKKPSMYPIEEIDVSKSMYQIE
jgi:hypothetical protein